MNLFVELVGLVLIAWASAILWCGWTSRRWPVVEGEVVTRTVREHRNRSRPYYVSAVRYRYVVGLVSYTGRRRQFGALSGTFVTEQAAYDSLDGLVPGTRVPVYHHPRLPRLAVLRPGYAVEALAPFALGVLLVIHTCDA